jgi:hypothetical protein
MDLAGSAPRFSFAGITLWRAPTGAGSTWSPPEIGARTRCCCAGIALYALPHNAIRVTHIEETLLICGECIDFSSVFPGRTMRWSIGEQSILIECRNPQLREEVRQFAVSRKRPHSVSAAVAQTDTVLTARGVCPHAITSDTMIICTLRRPSLLQRKEIWLLEPSGISLMVAT